MSRARDIADLSLVSARLDTVGGSEGALSNRNLIINGAMTVSQRGNSTGITGSAYCGPDRFQTILSSAGTWSISQSTTNPAGFANSLKFDCTTADASLSAGDYLILYHKFEGQNLQHLKKGTADAKKLTLSFWIRSNKTGTYQVNLYDNDNTRNIGKTYTIDTADTWEHKTLTFDGDTTGTFNNDANQSMNIEWWFAAGSNYNSGSVPTSWEASSDPDRAAGLNVNLADSTSNELYITGVQLEVGDTATDFEHRSFADEILRCRRYYHKQGTTYGHVIAMQNSTSCYSNPTFPVEMRAAPTVDIDHANINLYVQGAKTTSADFAQNIQPSSFQFHLQSSGAGAGDAGHIDAPTLFYTADAEL